MLAWKKIQKEVEKYKATDVKNPNTDETLKLFSASNAAVNDNESLVLQNFWPPVHRGARLLLRRELTFARDHVPVLRVEADGSEKGMMRKTASGIR